MTSQSKYYISIFFTIIFMAFIAAPTIIVSLDDSVDISIFYSLTEEEESENFKLIFDDKLEYSEVVYNLMANNFLIGYTFKSYPKPHLNLITPPPEFYCI